MVKARKSIVSPVSELDHLANAELAQRSLRVAFIYVPLTILVSLVTDLHKDFPAETYGYLGIFLIMGIVRTRQARNFKENNDSRSWLKKFILLTMIPAATLGSIPPMIFFSKGAGWDFIICTMSIIGITAGATSSLAPRKNIFRIFQCTLLLPTVLILAAFSNGKTQGMVLLLLLWLGQVLVLGHYSHKEFWANLRSRHQLKLRASTLEKAKTEVEQACRTKDDFLANMSHEIRTPLNGIIGMTDLVMESDLDQQQLSYLQDVKSSGETLLKIINEILDFSKIEAGGIEIESIPFSIKKMLDKVVRPLRFPAENRGNKLVIELDPDLPTRLFGDPHRLWQVLTNLASNAVKFTENGEITISARQLGQIGRRCTLMLSVSDTGIGISPQAQISIFKAFSQADGSTTRKYGGTGLGLAISQKLVQLMEGEITLNSSEGKGSTFAFLLHLDEAPAETIEFAKPLREAGTIDLSGLRILLAEDNPVNARLASRLLEKSGVLVELARDGKQAVEAWQNNTFDLVLMDVQMPVMDGFEATALIRKGELETGDHIPIIALTAHALDGYRDQCLENGMDDFLSKPLNPRVLRECLVLWSPQEEPQSV